MRKTKIVVAILLIAVLCTLCACDKKPPENPNNDRFDIKPGGFGSQAIDVTEYSTIDTSDYILSDVVNATIISASFERSENYYEIDLSTISQKDLSDISAYSYKDNELKIKSSGVYVLSGSFSGTITVNDTDGEVRLVLNGVDIKTTDSQDSAAIVFKKPEGDSTAERIITLIAGTTNTLSDSVGDNADGDGAVIQAKKRSLIINGTGTLQLNCVGEKASGIKVKKALYIDSANIVVSGAKKSGIKADETILIKNANVTVTADGDGIKTDIEPESEEEATKYASKNKYGYIYIENSNLNITSGDDGISANNCLYIANSDSNLIKITTNGGAPSKITETSSDNADGKAIKTDGIEFEDVTLEAGYEENYGLIITGGRFEINSNDDAIHSKGNVIISGGTFEISSGDDGIHAEYLTKITGGNITIDKSYEGIEGATVEILNGNIDVTSTDDGINAANSDLKNYSYYILIAGGDISVNADGDGLDSNGTLKITGGNLFVLGPTGNDNSALDADTGIIITGGNVCAVGSSGMVESPSDLSTQCYIVIGLNSKQNANTTITVETETGEKIFEYSPNKKYQAVILSLSDLNMNESYTVTVGNNSYSATLESIGTSLGKNLGGFMGMFGKNDIPNGNGVKPSDMPEMPENDQNFDPNNIPEKPNGDEGFDPNFKPDDMPNGDPNENGQQ